MTEHLYVLGKCDSLLKGYMKFSPKQMTAIFSFFLTLSFSSSIFANQLHQYVHAKNLDAIKRLYELAQEKFHRYSAQEDEDGRTPLQLAFLLNLNSIVAFLQSPSNRTKLPPLNMSVKATIPEETEEEIAAAEEEEEEEEDPFKYFDCTCHHPASS